MPLDDTSWPPHEPEPEPWFPPLPLLQPVWHEAYDIMEWAADKIAETLGIKLLPSQRIDIQRIIETACEDYQVANAEMTFDDDDDDNGAALYLMDDGRIIEREEPPDGWLERYDSLADMRFACMTPDGSDAGFRAALMALCDEMAGDDDGIEF